MSTIFYLRYLLLFTCLWSEPLSISLFSAISSKLLTTPGLRLDPGQKNMYLDRNKILYDTLKKVFFRGLALQTRVQNFCWIGAKNKKLDMKGQVFFIPLSPKINLFHLKSYLVSPFQRISKRGEIIFKKNTPLKFRSRDVNL